MHYTYRITWSTEDDEHVGLCAEFPSMSWLSKTPESALKGIRRVVSEVVTDMQAAGETIPVPLAEKHYSSEFRIRIPPQVHRALIADSAYTKTRRWRGFTTIPKSSVTPSSHFSGHVFVFRGRRGGRSQGATAQGNVPVLDPQAAAGAPATADRDPSTRNRILPGMWRPLGLSR